MLIGGIFAFILIFGLFLSMLAASPKPHPDAECHTDTDQ